MGQNYGIVTSSGGSSDIEISVSEVIGGNSGEVLVVGGAGELEQTNIKTINTTSLLGSGDVAVQPTLVSGTNIKTINTNSLLGSGNISVGTVTSVAALTLGTTGTDLSSTVANGTTTPVITLNVPTASATNRGVLSSTDWSTFNNKLSNITVGTTPLTSGTVGRILFEGSGNVLQEDAALFWDNTNKRLGVGATPSTSVRLDVRAQGALSTDIALRVRNSADSVSLLEFLGTGNLITRNAVSSLGLFHRTDTTGFSLTTGTSGYGTGSGCEQVSSTFYLLAASERMFSFTRNTWAGAVISWNFANIGDNSGDQGLHINRGSDPASIVIRSNRNIGIGTTSPGARLDVRAQGALSTDIAFRVRNSADTVSLLDFQGTGNLITRHNSSGSSLGLFHRTDTTGFSLTTGTSGYGTGTGIEIQGTSVWLLGSGARVFRFNPDGWSGTPIQWNISNVGDLSGAQGLNITRNDETDYNLVIRKNGVLCLGTYRAGASATKTFTIQTGTAPTGDIADQFQLYSNDITAGNAAPHFRTENGDIIKIYSVGGWGLPTGTFTRTTFNTATVTTAELAERVAALIQDLRDNHGLLKA